MFLFILANHMPSPKSAARKELKGSTLFDAKRRADET